MKPILIAIAIGVALAGQSASAGGFGYSDRTCSRTAAAAFSACLYEVLDDFWIDNGKCKNHADPDERADCLSDIRSAPREGHRECRAQKNARVDLCNELGEAPYDPPFEPAMFVNPADIGGSVAPNPWLPIIAGQTRIYEDGEETVTVTVTGDIKTISGVPCAVVRDIVEEDGEVIEDTQDWFAQDLLGNVWYCGEAVQDFEDGELVSLDGSFKAGVDGAKPGILMKAAPAVGDVYRQEFDLGNAEDAAEVLSLNGTATTPAASCSGTCIITRDFTPLEPEVLEHKYYAPGIGLILEVKPGTDERLELVEIIN
ncbi:MAG: hypothetical protein KJ040_07570 [Gammaproteobacteria bacterium]|nr:hypothetical protein [Gammaproteobacteria bacterium]